MKLPLRLGLPLLAVLLVGLGLTEGREWLVLLVAAMGVALWTAFSLPHPGPRPAQPDLLQQGRQADVTDATEDHDGGAGGSAGNRPT